MLVRFADKIYFYLSQCWNFLRPRRKLGLVSFVILASFVLVVWVVSTNVAHADVFPTWSEIVGWICDLILWVAQLFLKLTFFILSFVIEVAGYNGFIDSNAVIVGWVMVRDITNMFFVVVLLIISFGTILGLEQYEYKKLLVKLLLAAVIVNFSRIICGIVIDVAQVIMITFVNGIAATAGGNMVNMFGVQSIFQLNGNSSGLTGSDGEKFVAAVAAITFSAIMMVTMLTFLLLLMARMLTLWILIVLSPFAFVLNVLPQTQKFAGQWWTEFGGNVVAGPIIAFFLWLSFVTVGAGNVHDQIRDNSSAKMEESTDNPAETSAGITEIMNWEKMANFAIAIGMLLAGAKMAQQLGAAGGSMMGKAYDFGKKVAMTASGLTAARWGAGKAWQGAKGAGKLGLKVGDMGLAKIGLSTGDWKRRGRNIASWAKYKTIKKGWFGLPSTESRLIGAKNRVETAYGEGKRKFGQRAWAKVGLFFAPTAFREEYSKDKEARAKFAEEQMEHVVSTSKTPIGKEKTEAEARLKELQATGQDIKGRKIADIDEKSRQSRENIEAQLVGLETEDERKAKLKELEASGAFTDTAIFDYERWQSANQSAVKAEHLKGALESVRGRERAEEKEVLHGKEEVTNREKLAAEAKAETEKAKLKFETAQKEVAHAAETGVGLAEAKAEAEKAKLKLETAQKTAAHEAELGVGLPKAKAEAKQIEDTLNAEKQVEELQAIYNLIKEGGGKQERLTAGKAKLESLKEAADLFANKSTLLARAEEYRNPGREGGPDLLKASLAEQQAHSLELNKLKEVYKNAEIGANERGNIAAQLVQKMKEVRDSNLSEPEKNAALKSLVKQKDSLHDFSSTQFSYDAIREEEEELRQLEWTEPISNDNTGRRFLSRRLGRKVDAGKEKEAFDEYRDLVGAEEFQVRMRQLGAHAKVQQAQGNAGAFVYRETPNQKNGQLTGLTDYEPIVRTGAEVVKNMSGWLKNNFIDAKKMLQAAGTRRLGDAPGSGSALININEQEAAFNAEALGNFTNQSIASMGKRGFIGDLNGSAIDKASLAEQLSAFAAKATDKKAFDALTKNLKDILERLKVEQTELDDLWNSASKAPTPPSETPAGNQGGEGSRRRQQRGGRP